MVNILTKAMVETSPDEQNLNYSQVSFDQLHFPVLSRNLGITNFDTFPAVTFSLQPLPESSIDWATAVVGEGDKF